jgi:hypothetical protein
MSPSQGGRRHAAQFKKLLLWVVVGVSALRALPAVSADDFTVGNWQGAAYNGADSHFTHCGITASYKSGMYLLFAVNAAWGFNVGVADPRWKLETGKSYDVLFRVDNRFEKRLSATAVSDQLAIVQFVDPDAVPVFNALRHGRLLTIVANRTNLPFELQDTSLALTRLIDCVKSHKANEASEQARTSENPFSGSESNPPESRPP